MRHKKLKLSAVILFGFGLTGLHAQESINTAGGSTSGSGGSASFTVGQVFYQAHIPSNGSVSEGVQQPYEISVVTAIEEAESIDLMVSAYPNPTIDNLTLEIKDFETSSFQFQLYDMSGKLWQSEKITEFNTNIDLSFLLPGTYFLKIIQSNKDYKTFKIVKN